ncbi:hypothetical protein [Flavobacterium sp.]|uniref:hypothetical protein n=1 Tax=Flavobacterium sp. TaxID=239 RepID=UPI002B4B8FE5|nr:hypothetical protein [Flavobacterium sp.]HLF52574.1 hypothetical protein [Flavobacterium sp.]
MGNKVVRMGYGFVSDVEIVENHKLSLQQNKNYKNDHPPIFYNVKSVSLKTGIGRNKIYSLLREFNYIDDNNFPFQEYIDEGYFKYYQILSKGIISISPKGISLITSL